MEIVNGTTSEDRVRTLERRNILFDRATRLARLGAWECDLATEELTWTAGVYELFDLPLETRLKRAAIVDHYTDSSRHQMEATRGEVIRSGCPLAFDAQIRTRGGQHRWMRVSIDVVQEHGRPVRIFGAKQDVTAEREMFAQLRTLADQDGLTGLANRRAFEARYRMIVADEMNDGFVSALALVDLDRFKSINDGFGHAAGDECLRQVALRLRAAVPDATLVARIGGDEFAVLLPASRQPAEIRRLLQGASSALARPVMWNGRSVAVGASIGATILRRPHSRKRSELFAEADAALYAAKAAGRNMVRVFGDGEDVWSRATGTMAICVA